jgi:hypothetical protein
MDWSDQVELQGKFLEVPSSNLGLNNRILNFVYCPQLIWAYTDISNSMDYSPSWEADSSSANLEFTELLLNPYVHYSVSNGPPLIPIPSNENQIHSLAFYFFKLILILSHLLLGLRNGLRPSCFHRKPLKHDEFLFSTKHIKCHVHLKLHIMLFFSVSRYSLR